jgi:hypothetical protein
VTSCDNYVLSIGFIGFIGSTSRHVCCSKNSKWSIVLDVIFQALNTCLTLCSHISLVSDFHATVLFLLFNPCKHGDAFRC